MIRINKRVFLEHASNNALLKIKMLVRVSMCFAHHFSNAMISNDILDDQYLLLRSRLCSVQELHGGERRAAGDRGLTSVGLVQEAHTPRPPAPARLHSRLVTSLSVGDEFASPTAVLELYNSQAYYLKGLCTCTVHWLKPSICRTI